MLARLLPTLSQGLQQEPRVAANVCWVSRSQRFGYSRESLVSFTGDLLQALVSLVKAAYDNACGQGTDSSGQPDTYALSPCFGAMVDELIKTTDRLATALCTPSVSYSLEQWLTFGSFSKEGLAFLFSLRNGMNGDYSTSSL